MTNTLYYGDNLDILRRHVADESVDLIYLDPPFSSNADYNVLFAERDGTEAASAGISDSPWGTKHARIQILTIAGLLAGHGRIRSRFVWVNRPHCKAATGGRGPNG